MLLIAVAELNPANHRLRGYYDLRLEVKRPNYWDLDLLSCNLLPLMVVYLNCFRRQGLTIETSSVEHRGMLRKKYAGTLITPCVRANCILKNPGDLADAEKGEAFLARFETCRLHTEHCLCLFPRRLGSGARLHMASFWHA